MNTEFKEHLTTSLEQIKLLLTGSNVQMALEAIHGNVSCSHQLLVNNTIIALIDTLSTELKPTSDNPVESVKVERSEEIN